MPAMKGGLLLVCLCTIMFSLSTVNAEITYKQPDVELDPCLAYNTSCSECIAVEGCGWCPYYGECYTGTSAAPANASCPPDPQLGSWEKSACCSDLWNCSECSKNPACGWCDTAVACYLGTTDGPSSASDLLCKNSAYGGWEYGSCCLDYVDCGECTNNTKCGFCPTSMFCIAGNADGPLMGIQCPSNNLTGAWQYGDCCLEKNDCDTCVNTPSQMCGWCPTNSVCLRGDQSGPINASCPAGVSGAWTNDVCCSSRSNCSSCTGDGKCGWCPNSRLCYSGTEEGPTPGIACTAGDGPSWEFDVCCSDSTSCDQCSKFSSCGWCATEGCYPGNQTGPSGGSNCTTQWIGQKCNNLNSLLD